MKKNLLRIGFISLLIYSSSYSASDCSSSAACNECATATNCGSKSFFRPRSVIEDVSLYLGINEYYFHRKYFANDDSCEKNIHFARGIFYEKSSNRNASNNDRNVGRYFLPGNKQCVNINEDGSGDVGSLWLSVIAPDGLSYASTLCICPERQIWGGYTDWRQYFECVERMWLDVKFAIYQAKHNLRPTEVVANSSALGTLPNASTALQYLGSDNLKYGKIVNCGLTRSGFDDLQIRLGYDVLSCPDSGYYLGLYGSILAPLAPKPTAEFLFEPLVGRAHWGVGAGLNAGYTAYECENSKVTLMTDVSFEYLLKGTELRSFDFKRNGQWSRYMRVATSAQPAVSFPAINFTTLPVKVQPRGVLNLWGAVHYQHCSWHGELGYNLWWRQGERICPKSFNCNSDCQTTTNPFINGNLGIFGMGNVCTPTSASMANITQGKTFTGTGNVVVNDPVFVPIKLTDLDFTSAAQPASLTNKVYGALSYDTNWCCRPFSLGLGASYEFSRDKNAFNQWGVWGNFETSF